MAKEQLLPNSIEQAVNQIAVAETSKPSSWKAFQDIMTARRELPKITIPKKLQAAAFAGLAATIGTIGSIAVNPDTAFAMTPQEAKDGKENGTVVDTRTIGVDAQIELQKIQNPGSKIDKEISGNVDKGLGSLIPRDMLPKEVLSKITETNKSISEPSIPKPISSTEQPSMPNTISPTQQPRGGDFPTIPIIAGIGLLGAGLRIGNRELNKFKEKIAKEKSPRSKQGERPDYKIAERINEVKKGLKNQPTLEQFIDAVKAEFEGKPTINIAEFLKVKAQGGVEVGLGNKILLPAKFLFNKYNENWLVKDFEAPKTMDIEDYLSDAEIKRFEALGSFNPTDFGEAMAIIQDKFYSIKSNYGLSESYQAFPLKVDGSRDTGGLQTMLKPLVNASNPIVFSVVHEMLKKIIDA